jgi:hypothetical protein
MSDFPSARIRMYALGETPDTASTAVPTQLPVPPTELPKSRGSTTELPPGDSTPIDPTQPEDPFAALEEASEALEEASEAVTEAKEVLQGRSKKRR